MIIEVINFYSWWGLIEESWGVLQSYPRQLPFYSNFDQVRFSALFAALFPYLYLHFLVLLLKVVKSKLFLFNSCLSVSCVLLFI